MIGFGIWWYMAPEPLLLTPRALSAPDLPLVTNVVKDTFVNKVCNLHPEISRWLNGLHIRFCCEAKAIPLLCPIA